MSSIIPGAEPFHFDGSSQVGVLVCHGFTGSPMSMRAWGEHMAERGFTVRAPRLPGHGTSWQDLNRTSWQQWYEALREDYRRLQRDCQHVVAAGLSMGGTLCLRLAAEMGADLSGLVLVNPGLELRQRGTAALPLLSRVVPSIPGIGGDIAKPDENEMAYTRVPLRALSSLRDLMALTRQQLPQVRQPTLYLRSRTDNVLGPGSGRLLRDGIGSTEFTEVRLLHSYHVATVDHDAPLLFDRSASFIESLAAYREAAP